VGDLWIVLQVRREPVRKILGQDEGGHATEPGMRTLELVHEPPQVIPRLRLGRVDENDMVLQVPPPLAAAHALAPQGPQLEEGASRLGQEEDAGQVDQDDGGGPARGGLGREIAVAGRGDRGEGEPDPLPEGQALQRHHGGDVDADQDEKAEKGEPEPAPKVENDAAAIGIPGRAADVAEGARGQGWKHRA
jgi:hypothetical protein